MPKETTAQKESTSRSVWLRRALFLVLLFPVVSFAYAWITYPSDRTPEGAYLRIVKAVNQGRPREFFAYIEEAAQHACYSIGDYRKKSLSLAEQDFPPARFAELRQDYQQFADAPDGSDVFAIYAEQQGWLSQLRADVSGIDHVESQGPRATVETVKGTRYAFRKRPNGIWGLTAFTPILVEEAERAARDYKQVQKAAADFSRVKRRAAPGTGTGSGTEPNPAAGL